MNTMAQVSFPIMGAESWGGRGRRKPEKGKSCQDRTAEQGLSAEKQKNQTMYGNSWSKKRERYL